MLFVGPMIGKVFEGSATQLNRQAPNGVPICVGCPANGQGGPNGQGGGPGGAGS